MSEVGWCVPHSQQDALPCSAGGGPYCLVADLASCPSCGGVGSLVAVMVLSRSLAYTELNLISRLTGSEPAYFLTKSLVSVTERRPGPSAP